MRTRRASLVRVSLSRITMSTHSSRQQKERLPNGKRPWFGGAEEDRTPDLNTASVALSQLSYSPKRPFGPTFCVVVVEVRRLELLTSTVRLSRSPS